MAPRALTLLPILVALCFSIIAFVFSILAITSDKWAIRDYYDNVNPIDWNKPNFTMTKSPFSVCTARPTFVQYPGATPDDEPSLVLVNYTHSCIRFKPYGPNSTSCEVQSVTKTDSSINDGDARLCQQIHYAGNFGIASTVFISLGFLLILGLALSAALHLQSSGQYATSVTPGATEGHAQKQSTDERITEATHNTPTRAQRIENLAPVRSATFCAVLFSTIGVILGLISQHYGVLAFIQSSPNNADWASSAAGNSKDINSNIEGYHGPWYQGDALSMYLTCAWGFALAASATAYQTYAM